MELSDCINFLLTTTQKTVSQFFAEKISKFDITPAQYGVMRCLWRTDFQTPTQIAQALSLDSSSITGLLDRMDSKGLLRRVPSSDDRRVTQVMLTHRGKSFEKTLHPLVIEAHNEVLNSLSEHERESLIKSLNTVLSNVPKLESGKQKA